MEVIELFVSCRRGDLCRVRDLVEERDLELNVRDKWDSTPLYYACLCGHEELVEYLLENGAKCEANTFDGERCLYGALSDRIRRLLREYKQITSRRMVREFYDDFLERLLEQGSHSDVCFLVHGQSFRAHRCVLCARSPYFAEKFQSKWKGKTIISLMHPLVNPAAFGSILQYLYTGRMDTDVENIEDCRRLAKQCQLLELIEELDSKCKQVYEFVSTKPGTCVKVITVEAVDACRLRDDMELLADCAFPPELRVGFGELPFDCADTFPSYPDVCFEVDGNRFLCHKLFFCGRSDYFKALLEDHFSEASELHTEPSVCVVKLHNMSVGMFSTLLYYIYSDTAEHSVTLVSGTAAIIIVHGRSEPFDFRGSRTRDGRSVVFLLSSEEACEILPVADMYLLPGLKRLCGKALAHSLGEDNVLVMWRMAKLFSLPRLEDQCTKFMARILDKLVESDEFAETVKADAEAVEERQETDSVPLVDDIRFHVTSSVQTFSAMEEANQKLAALDALLARLGIEC